MSFLILSNRTYRTSFHLWIVSKAQRSTQQFWPSIALTILWETCFSSFSQSLLCIFLIYIYSLSYKLICANDTKRKQKASREDKREDKKGGCKKANWVSMYQHHSRPLSTFKFIHIHTLIFIREGYERGPGSVYYNFLSIITRSHDTRSDLKHLVFPWLQSQLTYI